MKIIDNISHLLGDDLTTLTRGTIAKILKGMNIAVFSQYKSNPEDFIHKASRLINEQKATVIVEHLSYDPLGDAFSSDIFTQEKNKDDFSKAVKTERHIFDYVFTDSKNEKAFVQELDASSEVVVYAKLPRGFFIPTPVGDYNPDWAISAADYSTVLAHLPSLVLTLPMERERIFEAIFILVSCNRPPRACGPYRARVMPRKDGANDNEFFDRGAQRNCFNR